MARGRGVAVALVQAAILVGCSGIPAISPSPEPSQAPAPTATMAPTPAATATQTTAPSPTAAAEERIFSFDDGALTIIAPAGALPAGVDLVATARGPDDRPPELADVSMSGTFYRLEPDGLTFAQPVTLIRRVALADLGIAPGDPVPIIALALRTSDGIWNWLDNPALMNDGEYLYVSGEATHTSQVFGFGGTNYSVRDGQGSGPGYGPDHDLSLPVGVDWVLTTNVTVPTDAPAPPTIGLANPFAVSPTFLGRYRGLYPDRFDEPFTHNGALVSSTRFNNPTGWQELSADQRADSFPAADFDLSCIQVGHFYTIVGYEVVNLGAGSPLWDTLRLGTPSTNVLFPLRGDCVERAPQVEVASACLITIHTARGTYVSYMRGLIEFIEILGGPTVEGVEVTLGGANDGEPAVGEPQSGTVWEFTSGLHSAGPKKIEKVVATLSGGQAVDVTAMVIGLLGTDTIDVPFPGEPIFGTCPKGAN